MSYRRRLLLRKRTETTGLELEEIATFSGSSSGDQYLSMTRSFNAMRGCEIETTFTVEGISYAQGRIIGFYSNNSSLLHEYVVQINTYPDGGPHVLARTATGWIGLFDDSMSNCVGHTFTVKMRYEPGKKLHIVVSSSSGLFYEETFPNVAVIEGDYTDLILTGDPLWSNGNCKVTFDYLIVRN